MSQNQPNAQGDNNVSFYMPPESGKIVGLSRGSVRTQNREVDRERSISKNVLVKIETVSKRGGVFEVDVDGIVLLY